MERGCSQEAARWIFKEQPEDTNLLRSVIRFTKDSDTEKQAVELILKQEPIDFNLCWIIVYADNPEMQKRAAKLLLERDLDAFNMSWLIKCVNDPEILQQAWRKLLKQKPSDYELQSVINDFLEARNKQEIGDLLLYLLKRLKTVRN